MILSSHTHTDASNMRTKANETFVSDFDIKYLTFFVPDSHFKYIMMLLLISV